MTSRQLPAATPTPSVLLRPGDTCTGGKAHSSNDKLGPVIEKLGRTTRAVRLIGLFCGTTGIAIFGLYNWHLIPDFIAEASESILCGTLTLALARRGVVERRTMFEATTDRDSRAVGPLCVILATPGYGIRRRNRRLEAELLRLVPLLSYEDGDKLTTQQRSALIKILRGSNDELIRTVMIAVSSFNYADALPFIERLANGRGAARTNMDIRRIAAEVAPTLRARLELMQSDHTLLRPSDENKGIASTALRPSEHVDGPSEIDQLLRGHLP